MEVTSLGFPIFQLLKHDREAAETSRILAEFEKKKQATADRSLISSGSMTTGSIASKRGGKLHSMESLDECLNNNCTDLKRYASRVELNGENVVFLVKVLEFQSQWDRIFSRNPDFNKARSLMFRAALNVYLNLVYDKTAMYPINVESPIYQHLHKTFGAAAEIMALAKRGSVHSSPNSIVTPWDEPLETDGHSIALESEAVLVLPPPSTRLGPQFDSNESALHMISPDMPLNPLDPLAGVSAPVNFNECVFEAAFKSIKYMVWTETWQRYMQWKVSKETRL